MNAPRAALGVVNHCGWAAVVCVAEPRDVLDRRRIELLGEGLPSLPYEHHVPGLDTAEAEALIARVRESAAAHARAALETAVAELAPRARVVALAIREGPARPIPGTVPEVLASRAATYAADGELFRSAVEDAAKDLGLAVCIQPRGLELAHASTAIGSDVTALLADLGRSLGPPWNKDYRVAAAGALVALARPG